MRLHYDRFLSILKKWPLDTSKMDRDYGRHLREIIKEKEKNYLFQGSEKEVSEKLNSLLRIAENRYGSKYTHNLKIGVMGMTCPYLHQILSDEFVEEYNRKKVRF